jgi:dTDP-4-amino-4,6-dideoxygalactose transaminase
MISVALLLCARIPSHRDIGTADIVRTTRKGVRALSAAGADAPCSVHMLWEMSAAPTRVRVPFVDLWPSHGPLRDDVLAGVDALLASGAFTNGPQVADFEEAFAAWCGVSEAVGIANGLDALRLGLIALGLAPGDEVVIPAQTFVATAEAVLQAGGVPVLADVEEHSACLDPEAVDAVVTERTRALVPVHLFGRLADMDGLRAVAERHDLLVIEDAAQAHGAERGGRKAGAFGDAAAFSFYPGKNLGAMGDAGALVTGDPRVAEVSRALREHGQREKYHHELVGFTARLDTVQALFLSLKLPHLDGWNDERRQAARRYNELLAGVGDLVLPEDPGDAHVWHLYVVRTASPDALAAHLRDAGIGVGRHYPVPVHLNAAFAPLGHREGAFPVAEGWARDCVSLPIFPGITEQQLEAVTDAVTSWFAGG